MDFLQAALILLILVLSILLSITGFYVFLILKDLKRALDRLNRILDAGEDVASVLDSGAKAISRVIKKEPKIPAPVKRFFKKSR